MNRHVGLSIAFATGLSLEVLAVPQAPIRDSPRPRNGAGPPPYAAIEVAFQNAVDNVQLAGTLTVPRRASSAPAVLLSQGLGLEPFDRDYTLPSRFATNVLANSGHSRQNPPRQTRFRRAWHRSC